MKRLVSALENIRCTNFKFSFQLTNSNLRRYTEASYDSSWYVPLHATPPATVNARTGEYINVHPDCFVPPPSFVRVYPTAKVVAAAAAEEEEEVDDWAGWCRLTPS